MSVTPGEPVPQRIGDAERDRAVELLREHLAQGRLDDTEFDERLTAALSARTSGDLDPLFTDLPGPRPGQGLAPTGDTTPLGASQTGLSPTQPSTEAGAPGKKWNTALLTASAIAWPLTLLILFATGWDHWWLIFIPIIISSVAGKNRHDTDHGRHRDGNRDRVENRDDDRDDRRGIAS